jgi:hypothetical protein
LVKALFDRFNGYLNAKGYMARGGQIIDATIVSALGDHFPLVLGHSGQDVNGQLVGVWVINGHEFNAAVHQGGDKGQISAQPIEFGNHKSCLVFLAGC